MRRLKSKAYLLFQFYQSHASERRMTLAPPFKAELDIHE